MGQLKNYWPLPFRATWPKGLIIDIQDYDEDELEAELDALGEELELEEQEELDKMLIGPAAPTSLPDVIFFTSFLHLCPFV